MTAFVLLRHGVTDWNDGGRFQVISQGERAVFDQKVVVAADKEEGGRSARHRPLTLASGPRLGKQN